MYKRMRKMLFLMVVGCCLTGCKSKVETYNEPVEELVAEEKETEEMETEEKETEESVTEEMTTDKVVVDRESGEAKVFHNGVLENEIPPVETTKKVEKVIINKTAGTARIIYDDGTETMR